jgi:hypothetical protein
MKRPATAAFNMCFLWLTMIGHEPYGVVGSNGLNDGYTGLRPRGITM